MRTLATILSFLFLGAIASAQSTRDSVPLLEPTLSDEAKKGFETIAKTVLDLGYDDAAETIRGWTKGVYGSGTVVSLGDGKNYLVTNRHVAANSDSVKVTFMAADGTKIVWNDCPVLFFDPRVDLALIGIPDGQKPRALPLVKSVPEGSEVWSAGFPGLGGHPEWQLAKGNITNAAVTVADVGPEADAVFYQHSAAIDPGSSGGALLKGDPTKPDQLQVVGINTLTARGRSNAFYAIPAATVAQSVSRYLEARDVPLEKTVEQLQGFLGTLEWDKYAYRSLLSYRYGALEGWDAFDKAFEKLSKKDRALWGERFGSGPLDALGQFLSFQLWNRVHGATAKVVLASTDQSAPQSPVSRFTLGEDAFTVRWIREASQWKVASVEWESDKKAAAAPVKVNFEAPIPKGFSLRAHGILPVGDSWNTSPGLGFALDSDGTFVGPLALASRFEFIQESPSKTDFTKKPATDKYNLVGYSLGLRYFFNLTAFSGVVIHPYLGVLAGFDVSFPQFQGSMSASTSDSALAGFLLTGMVEPQLGVEVSLNKGVALGTSASIRWYTYGLHGIESVPIGFYVKWTTL